MGWNTRGERASRIGLLSSFIIKQCSLRDLQDMERAQGIQLNLRIFGVLAQLGNARLAH